MPAQQRTFDLIPTTLVKSNTYRPPTTSKAAKKAYQQANKGPRISRAEQRRRDSAELERQKKEYERERAAAKAKAAREKKAAKANAEKEERKRMGLPEPSRFVRASQPTISRFVRSESGKRSWQEMDTACVEEDSDDTVTEGVVELNKEELPAKKVAIEESEDEFGDFPSLSQIDILEKIDNSMLLAKEVVQEVTSPARISDPTQELVHQSPELPNRKVVEDDYQFVDSQAFGEMANTQLLSEAAEAVPKSDAIEPQADQPVQSNGGSKPVTINQSYDAPMERRTVKRQENCALPAVNKPVLQARSTNMPPPNISIKRSINYTPEPPEQVRIPPAALARSVFSAPPSSTQAFLEAHIDDFFPSPTQQVRELLDDIEDDDLPSNTQIAKEISPEERSPRTVQLREPVLPSLPNAAFDDVDDYSNLICTQDLVFSSQELAEITTPSRPPPTPKDLISKPKPEPPKPRGRYFEEKEEDSPHQRVPSTNLESNRLLEPVLEAPKPKGRFFQEKEVDLIQAAIHASKLEAEQQAKKWTDTRMPEPSASRVPLRQESQKAPAKEPQQLSLREEPRPPTLTRVQSTTSDYGDDDFSGCSQELLAIC